MANKPSLKKVEIKQLQKKMGKPADSAKIYGADITADDVVTVKGTKGKKPTIWKGTIHKDKTSDGNFKTENLKVESEQENEKKDSDVSGTEDVSVTVTNSVTGESNAVTAKSVPVIP